MPLLVSWRAPVVHPLAAGQGILSKSRIYNLITACALLKAVFMCLMTKIRGDAEELHTFQLGVFCQIA